MPLAFVIWVRILIIVDFIFATPKPLKYSIFEEEKFIYRRFALHNS